MIKKILLTLAVFLGLASFAHAQNFNTITAIIDSPKITNAQAAYLAASYMAVNNKINLTDRSTEKDAFDLLKAKGFFTEKDNADDFITLKKLCSVFAKATDAKGGLFYMLSKQSPRYAYKEFVARGYVPAKSDPHSTVKGSDAIGLFNSITGGSK